MKRFLIIVPLLVLVISAGNSGSTNKEQFPSEQFPPKVLKASEVFFKDVLAMTSGTYNGHQRFYVFHSDSFIIYNEERNIIAKVDISGDFYPSDPVIDSKGNIYLINSATSDIVKIGPNGQWGGSFRVQEFPFSLAVLSNGNIVVASPKDGKLLHIYSNSGRKLRSFGDIKLFNVMNNSQNLFLNRGKVVVDSSDNIYFVFKYAPMPTFLKFSKKGKLISEVAIEGYAIDIQAEVARNYLSTKPLNEVGSIVITNSATIDPSTGHLWICMNGSSRSGVVYEYSRKGKKLREYSFVIDLPSIAPRVLTYVTDILVKAPSIYIFVDSGIYYVSSDKDKATDGFVFPQEACPPAQTWDGCSATCPTGSCPTSRNCKQTLESQVSEGLRIIGSSCQSLGPGQGTPPKPNGGCIATVTTCNTTTGEQVTLSTNQNCNPVMYSCQGTDCVVDCNGIYTTSNCNGQCTGGGGGCIWQPCEIGVWDPLICDCDPSPIVIDTNGNGFNLTDLNNGVHFDLNNDNTAERLSWTAADSDDAWLA